MNSDFGNLKKLEETTYFGKEYIGDKMDEFGLWDSFATGISDKINETYIIELGVSAMEKPEVQDAMYKEVENMLNYKVFGKKAKITPGMNVIGSRFVNTQSEAQDGQKTKIKSRLVCQGFAEDQKPQADSPTANRESLRLFLSVSASLGFQNLCSIDVSAAFLQAEKLDREVYVKLPKFMNPDESYAYKLEKPLYGLTDAGRKFWLRLKKILKDDGFVQTLGDDCFYRKYGKDGKLSGFEVEYKTDDSDSLGSQKLSIKRMTPTVWVRRS